MFYLSDDNADKLILMANYRPDKFSQVEESDSTAGDAKDEQESGNCAGGVCSILWKPSRPKLKDANAA